MSHPIGFLLEAGTVHALLAHYSDDLGDFDDPGVRGQEVTVPRLLGPGAPRCTVITTYMYAMRIMLSAFLPVRVYALLDHVLLMREATQLPVTDQTVLIQLLRLFLPLPLAAPTMTWPPSIPHALTT